MGAWFNNFNAKLKFEVIIAFGQSERRWSLDAVLVLLYRLIRLTTPILNNLIAIGTILMYLSVFFGVMPTTKKDMFHAGCIVS